ncbi:hypothetical protein JW848_05365 [Candidatus Bipolaricaulota bacterium]|nr:hypothetical protein [Candidatus Bipolaricaulota bacterium]
MGKRMWSTVGVIVAIALVALMGMGQQPEEEGLTFGFGISSAVAFFPDLTGVNAFLSENDLPPFCEVLLGGGGFGRGGTIGGVAVGGGGWGLVASSCAGNRWADLVSAGGGFDMGWAIGGDEGSVLTVGALLGGGATFLDLSAVETNTLHAAVGPVGITIDPTERSFGRVSAFVAPYVSMQVQLLSWMGFELRIGYVVPFLGFDFEEGVGIPAPSLDLSGPILSLGVTFGGIGGPSDRDEEAAPIAGTTVLQDGAGLRVESGVGDIIIVSYEPEVTQTGSVRAVEWFAVPDCSQREMEEGGVAVEVEEGSGETTLRAVGEERMDLEIRVPAGTDLALRNGVGLIQISDHRAQVIVVENGVGEIILERIDGLGVVVAHGIGSVRLIDVDAIGLTVAVGIGEIALDVDPNASVTVTASAGVGDVDFRGFPDPIVVWTARGFLSEAGKLVLGGGEAVYELSAGLGSIVVEPLEPWNS